MNIRFNEKYFQKNVQLSIFQIDLDCFMSLHDYFEIVKSYLLQVFTGSDREIADLSKISNGRRY